MFLFFCFYMELQLPRGLVSDAVSKGAVFMGAVVVE